mgnify:CR=1 FL=1
MGLAYGIGTAITYPVTGAALNPARATGIAIFAQNQGLNEEPLQTAVGLLDLPCSCRCSCCSRRHRRGMIGTKKNVPDTVETIDEVEGNTVLGEASVADGNDGEQDEQSYAQANADESVESN